MTDQQIIDQHIIIPQTNIPLISIPQIIYVFSFFLPIRRNRDSGLSFR